MDRTILSWLAGIFIGSITLNAGLLKYIESKERGIVNASVFLNLALSAVGMVFIFLLTGYKQIAGIFGAYNTLSYLILYLVFQTGKSRFNLPTILLVVVVGSSITWIVLFSGLFPQPPDPTPTPSVEPAPTFTPTVTIGVPESTITITPTPILFGTVTADHVNVRSGPGQEYEALAQYDTGVELRVWAESADEKWIVVSLLDGGHGWIAADYFQIAGSYSILAIATAPPTKVMPTHPPVDKCIKWNRQGDTIKKSYGTNSGDPGYNSQADLNNDGRVDIVDIGIWVDRNPGGCT